MYYTFRKGEANMNWIQSLSAAINFIENNLTQEISTGEIARHAGASGSHFQLIFNVVMGMTVGEYIRNRRLSLAAQDLLHGNRIIDTAMLYQYDTQESFSKAFTRFHGVPPSKLQRGQAKQFHPFTINVTIQGGFDMGQKFVGEFNLLDWSRIDETLTNEEKYKRITDWALSARGRNPNVFDALTEWILDDAAWSADKLAENEQILMQGVFARFKEQNAKLRAYLKALEPSGVVNTAVFKALDRFDTELSGLPMDERLQETVAKVFADFSVMQERGVRRLFAGNKTGPHGTNNVEQYGYINYLKDCDAQIQWNLFMPDVVARQQDGFKVESFEYKKMPAMRFIGINDGQFHGDSQSKNANLGGYMRTLDAMEEYKSGFDHDILLVHHYGKGVDVEPGHAFWGRFMAADTPVPEGFVHFDFTPDNDNKAGFPFLSQFAFATFSGDVDAMHKGEGYDVSGLYDITRNIILGQGAHIPYPDKYWTAEVFLNGWGNPGTAFLFSALPPCCDNNHFTD